MIDKTFIICVVAVCCVQSRVIDGTKKGEQLFSIDDYLERYGYLEKRTLEEGIANSDADRRAAIRSFQEFNGLDATGDIDEATLIKMKQPRCGVKDIVKERASGKESQGPLNFFAPGYRWPQKTITWKSSRPTNQLTESTQRYAFENAFKYWSDVTPLKFEYTYGEPDIDIQFATRDHGDGKYNAFDGKGGVLAHAYFPTNGDAHFDDEERWVFRSNSGTDLETVAAHEFGHALGLSHSTVPGSLMAPTYKGFDPNFRLHEDDIKGIQSLYGTKDSATTTTSTTTTTTTAAPSTTTSPSVTPSSDFPPCSMKFDAITLGPDGYTYVFRNKFVYRLDENGHVGTFLSRHIYPKAPKHPSAAVYIKDTDKTFIFKGNKTWRYSGFQLDSGYPITFDSSEFPVTIHAGIALKLSSRQQQVYLFGGRYFKEFNVNTNEFVPGKPLLISRFWRGIPKGIEAAMQWKDNDIYFFKGNKYRRFDPRYRSVKLGYPKDKAPAWLGGKCGTAPK